MAAVLRTYETDRGCRLLSESFVLAAEGCNLRSCTKLEAIVPQL